MKQTVEKSEKLSMEVEFENHINKLLRTPVENDFIKGKHYASNFVKKFFQSNKSIDRAKFFITNIIELTEGDKGKSTFGDNKEEYNGFMSTLRDLFNFLEYIKSVNN
ncbi:hypothetical protein BFS06_14315 [Clostridium perfringens]|uniref:Uncharacterized protein n=1 Tax=Clostridium perfringens TaxID=1502 RepID=A0A140GRF0_CLOPF|nr:hypothetical protein [Clostridium perfringens]AMN31109.1 hypothetical protein JFP838_pA0193 [Clostridium perfringens]TBX14380.1 hypothetical protein BFS06_14315 [Clostridium perfringens]